MLSIKFNNRSFQCTCASLRQLWTNLSMSQVAMNILNNGRFGMGACLTGTMKMLIEKATEHAVQRKQFVSKLKDYQG